MKSFEQLARAAFETYKKKRCPLLPADQTSSWEQLDEATRDAWRAVARQIVAEMATVH